MCQICTIAYSRSQTITTRYSPSQLDRTPANPQVFNLNQFSTAIQTTRSVEAGQTQTVGLSQPSTHARSEAS
jgi:hypothetical protein